MKLLRVKATSTHLQALAWIVVYIVLFISLLPMDGPLQSAVYAFINVVFYALIIYGNINFIYPRLYKKNKLLYILAAAALLISCGIGRYAVVYNVYNKFFATHIEPYSIKSAIYIITQGILTFVLSFIFRIALAYFTLKQQADEILVEKSKAELNLLKSQVQPHFMFNTLNNIYYEAYKEAPRTAALIERLSEIMRYFVDESPKQYVSLDTEISFLENYIALEKIRIRTDVPVTFIKECNKDLRLPPMLLMTFVENIFKHGIDKTKSDNSVRLTLTQEDNFLLFKACNKIYKDNVPTNKSTGFGLKNLKARLDLLYGSNFELTIDKGEEYYSATLKFPVQ